MAPTLVLLPLSPESLLLSLEGAGAEVSGAGVEEEGWGPVVGVAVPWTVACTQGKQRTELHLKG